MTKELRFTESESTAVIGGLSTALLGTWIFIKNYAIKVIKKRNDNIEQRLTTLEKGQDTLEKGQDSLMMKVREINHKIDNNDKGAAGAFQVVLDRLEEISKKENGAILELYKAIDGLKNDKK